MMNNNYLKKILTTILAFVIFIMLTGCDNPYDKFIKASFSVKKLNDNFYYMEFSGDYKLDELLKNGGCKTNRELSTFIEALMRGQNVDGVNWEEVALNTGCAAMQVKDVSNGKTEYIFGRNYDWDELTSALILYTKPLVGYESITTCQLDFLGFGDGFKPDSFGNRYMSAAAIFVPLDGMNEKGLCVSDLMAGDDEETSQDTGKSNLTTTLAIRALLDYCADVPEAVQFLKEHDMHSVIGRAHHFAISDACGRFVAVEYINNEMHVVETNALTNHYLAGNKSMATRENSIFRRNVLLKEIEDHDGIMTEQQAADALMKIRASQYDDYDMTWWRAMFNQTELTVKYTFSEAYDEAPGFTFSFSKKE